MKKRQYKILAILLSMSLTTISCTNINKDESVIKEILPEYTLEKNEDKFVINREDLLIKYEDYFNNIKYNYNGEEYYLKDEDILSIIDKSKSTQECSYVFDGDIDALIEGINNNSSQYLINNKNKYYSAFIDDFSKDNIYFSEQAYFEVALNSVLNNLLNHAQNDINEDFCSFQNLSIVYGFLNAPGMDKKQELVLASYYQEEKKIVLDYEAIGYSLAILKKHDPKIDEIAILKLVITHELNHVRQKCCDCRIDLGQLYISLDYYDNYAMTLTESSAESDLYNNCAYYDLNRIRIKDYNYLDERRYESYILMLGLLNKTKDDYYNAIFDTDLNDFLAFVNADDFEEIKSLYRIMFAIDAIFERNDFIANMGNDGLSMQEKEELVGYEYRYEIFNKVIMNLINYTENNEEFTVEDNLVIFRIVESILLNEGYLPTDDEEYQDNFNLDMVSKFYSSHQKYIEFIKEYYQINDEQLEESYNESSNIIVDIQCIINDYPRTYTPVSTQLKSLNLLDRYPLLQNIIKTNNLYVFTTNSIYDSCGLTLEISSLPSY